MSVELGILFGIILGVSIGTFVSNSVEKKRREIEIITSNRLKSIQSLKSISCKYFRYINCYLNKCIPENYNEWINEVIELTYQIKMNLNLKGYYDKKIINNMQVINDLSKKVFNIERDKTDIKLLDITNEVEKLHLDIESLLRLTEMYVQVYIKCEWEYVKFEAKEGVNTEFNFDKVYGSILEDIKGTQEVEDNIIDCEYELEDKDDRNKLVEFLRDAKNSQQNKINSSTIKVGTLVALIGVSLLYFASNLPIKKPSINEFSMISIICSYIIGIFIIGFDIVNVTFRKSSVESNILKSYNDIRKQYMLPLLLAVLLVCIIYIVFNIVALRHLLNSPNYSNIHILLMYVMLILIIMKTIINILILMSNYNINIKVNNNKSLDISKKGLYIVSEETCKDKSMLSKFNIVERLTKFIIYITPGALFLLQTFALYDIVFTFESKKILISSIYICGCLFSFVYIARYYSHKIIYSWLEQLYNRAFYEQTSINEIKAEFKAGYGTVNSMETASFVRRDS